jgi:hypothetical protein
MTQPEPGRPPDADAAHVLPRAEPRQIELHFNTALVGSEQARPHLLGSPGPGWLLADPESLDALRALLEQAGFRIGRDFTMERAQEALSMTPWST